MKLLDAASFHGNTRGLCTCFQVICHHCCSFFLDKKAKCSTIVKTYSFAVQYYSRGVCPYCALHAAGTRVVDTYTRLHTRRVRVDGTATQALRLENVQLTFNCGWGREGVTRVYTYVSVSKLGRSYILEADGYTQLLY